jgi:hypothetical protein
MICYSNLIHSFFCLALTKAEIDRLVGNLFDKDPLVPQLDIVPMLYCTKNPPPLVRTIAIFILHMIYD